MSRKAISTAIKSFAALGILALLAQFVIFVVDQRELAVVLRFGRPVRSVTEPGLYFKTPFIESVRYLPSTLQFWGDTTSETLRDLPTKDNKKIELVPWAVWRVNDPISFVQRLRTMDNAEQRVAQFVRGAMRDVITQYDLEDLVRSTNREMKVAQLEWDEDDARSAADGVIPMADSPAPGKSHVLGRQSILKKINEDAHRRLATTTAEEEGGGARGIELIDVGISHIDFVAAVQRTTFDRWISERNAISTRNVKEGEQAKQEILNKTNAEIERIHGEGQRKASELRGRADAEVIKKYADAIDSVGEFYTFVRTLEAYEKAISENTEMILTTDNDFLRQFQHFNNALEPASSSLAPSR
ncbi:MAG: protease modulator HflC [Planctomycetales bacterium]|nr:protease modulator HflC [Planctomycetales bacterium]